MEEKSTIVDLKCKKLCQLALLLGITTMQELPHHLQNSVSCRTEIVEITLDEYQFWPHRAWQYLDVDLPQGKINEDAFLAAVADRAKDVKRIEFFFVPQDGEGDWLQDASPPWKRWTPPGSSGDKLVSVDLAKDMLVSSGASCALLMVSQALDLFTHIPVHSPFEGFPNELLAVLGSKLEENALGDFDRSAVHLENWTEKASALCIGIKKIVCAIFYYNKGDHGTMY